MLSIQLLAAATAAALGTFTDPNGQFTVDFPPGWSAPVVDATGSIQSNAPDGTVYCRANARRMLSLDGLNQEALNTEFREPLAQATWAGMYEVDVSKLQISEGSARLVDGRIVQFVTLTLAPDLLGAPMKVRTASIILPGRMVNVGCFAPAGSFDPARATFENIIISLKPR